MAGAAFPLEGGPGILPETASFETTLRGASVVGAGQNRPVGLVLRVGSAEGSGSAKPASEETFEIGLVDDEGRHLMSLGPFGEEEVIATWRGLGASSGLELMVARRDGSVEKPYPQIGRVQLGEVRIRRRRGPLGGRRPRFLVRRKTARLPVRPSVYRGERELADGRGA